MGTSDYPWQTLSLHSGLLFLFLFSFSFLLRPTTAPPFSVFKSLWVSLWMGTSYNHWQTLSLPSGLLFLFFLVFYFSFFCVQRPSLPFQFSSLSSDNPWKALYLAYRLLFLFFFVFIFFHFFRVRQPHLPGAFLAYGLMFLFFFFSSIFCCCCCCVKRPHLPFQFSSLSGCPYEWALVIIPDTQNGGPGCHKLTAPSPGYSGTAFSSPFYLVSGISCLVMVMQDALWSD